MRPMHIEGVRFNGACLKASGLTAPVCVLWFSGYTERGVGRQWSKLATTWLAACRPLSSFFGGKR
jgi:hypothetical protein